MQHNGSNPLILLVLKHPLNMFRPQGYAVDSRTYYILGLSFWRSEADKLAKSPRGQSF